MKLDVEKGNHFYLNKKKSFNPLVIDQKTIKETFDFAYSMIFEEGYHRNHRSGGEHQRKKGELFANTFQGKLAEFVVYNTLKKNNCTGLTKPDITIHGKGIWDDVDLVYKEKKINVKSASFFSNLLLLESKDWNKNATYIPNIKSDSSSKYDYFVMVRIKPDIKGMFKKDGLLYIDKINHQKLKNIIFTNIWYYDFGGVCSFETIKYVIDNGYFLPKNSLLNGKVKMDADNYYIQTGDLKGFSFLINQLTKL